MLSDETANIRLTVKKISLRLIGRISHAAVRDKRGVKFRTRRERETQWNCDNWFRISTIHRKYAYLFKGKINLGV